MLAEKLALSENYICLIEKGKRTPSLKTIARIAEVLGVSAGSLINEAIRKELLVSEETVDEGLKKILIELENQYGLDNILEVLVKNLRETESTTQKRK